MNMKKKFTCKRLFSSSCLLFLQYNFLTLIQGMNMFENSININTLCYNALLLKKKKNGRNHKNCSFRTLFGQKQGQHGPFPKGPKSNSNAFFGNNLWNFRHFKRIEDNRSTPFLSHWVKCVLNTTTAHGVHQAPWGQSKREISKNICHSI